MKIQILVLLFCSISTILSAQPGPDLSTFQYRHAGPYRGGRVTAVTGVESQPHLFYMGATGGGIWKTEDYGTTWTNVSDGYFNTPSIGAIRVAKNDPNIIYAGTGSDGLRSNVITGKGVYKSIDGGATWTHTGLEKTGQTGAVEIHPLDHNIAYVAAIGQAFQPNPERGVYRTKNGGESWEKILFLSDTTGFSDLELMPSNPNILYAAAWRAERKPWTIISGGLENGIYKSTDGGDHWRKITKGLPEGVVGKIDLAVSAADSKVVYALVEAHGKAGGLYRSDDQGESFRQVSHDKNLTIRPFYFLNVDADPTNADVVYVNSLHFSKSTNGGKTWRKIATPHGDNHDMWINPANPNLMIQANDGGANVSHNGGKTWSTQFNQPTAELYQVEADNQHPYWLYAGQQDNYSTIAIPSIPPGAHQAGATGFMTNTGGCETGPAVPKPGNPDIVYSNCKGRFSVFNKRTGQEQRYDVGAGYMYGHNPKDLEFRFQRVSPIHISPHDENIIYHASQYLHRSTDEGKTWEIISPDLTAFEPDKQVISGGPITRDITGEEFYSTIYSIRESVLEKGLIWTGANDGPVYVTRNGGQDWSEVTPEHLPPGGRVDAVAPSSHQASKAYIAVQRYQLGDWKPYIFKTENYGKSWQLIANGIPSDFPVRVVREDPDREGLLYAGTEFGLFVSFNDGRQWHSFQQNLPVTPVTDLKVHRKDLVISTMGRGFWILDDLTPLHQLYDQKDTSAVHLFRPKDTYQYRYSSFGGIEELPSPKYPQPGVIIHYYLPDSISGILRLDIVNENGQRVRTLISQTDSIRKKSMAFRDMATNEVTWSVFRGLKNKRGLHRIRWDMRHTGAWHKNEKRRYQNGPRVRPGRYTLQLHAGDEIYEESFQLNADPRVIAGGVSLSDIQQQEAFNLEVTNLLSDARMLAEKVKAAVKELTKRNDLNAEEKNRLVRLQTLEAKLVTKKGTYQQPMFIDQAGYLSGIVNGAEQLPGRDAYERLDELKETFKDLKMAFSIRH